ncbi:ubinuclein-1 [Belonocnema kinseyi]|uniref:ubinuclein-1 n=1 Tax=Belonocnema kinseyi TaxID=2817044 RepID=UPI00143CFC2A|nr:ubinuclein-1 [Belonocnema kinseyi]
MSEPKRVPLQTLEFANAAKKDKGKQLLPSHRFTLTLLESNEKTCPEFDYAQLLKAAERKRGKEYKRKDENTTNGGLDPYDDDDEDKLKEMAKKFEAKYGNATSGKKSHKFQGYPDLGAGYDENDSFIDNTDAYDEIVPDEVTTAHGGFYINSGALEFKSANNNNINNINNDNDDEDESSKSDEEEDESPKRLDKRVLSSSEDEEAEEIARDHPAKKPKMEETVEKRPNNESVIRKKKKPIYQPEEPQQNHCPQINKDETLNKNSELKVETSENGNNADEPEEKKKQGKPNEVPRAKTVLEKKFDIKRFEKKVMSNGYDAKKVEGKKVVDVEKDSKIDDAIESVVNASRVDIDESSRETSDSGKSRGAPGTESDCEELDKQECPLPDCLEDGVKEICNNLKILARTATGKSKFFTQDVNCSLFKLETKLRLMNANNIRLQTYRHLAHYLPCTKTTLINRAKKLHTQHQDRNVKTQLEKLKAIIDSVMPIAEEKYKKECQRIVEEKGFQSPTRDPLADSEGEENSVKNGDKIPRQKFPWSDESKTIVREIAASRKHYFKISRPRKENVESFVASFLESRVLPLWPAGWMKIETLLKYANSHPTPKKKQKKSKDIIIASGSVNNTLKCDHISNNISILGLDKGKSPSSSYTVNSTENSLNLKISVQNAKSSDSSNEKKHKEKGNSSLSSSPLLENTTLMNNVPIGKISVVPTAQLMAPKLSTLNHLDKFNPMDLTSTSISITPVVNDYPKPLAIKSTEIKKDIVSITPSLGESNLPQSLFLPKQEIPSPIANPNSAMVSMPIRVLQEAAIDTNNEMKVDDDLELLKAEKKRDRYFDDRPKSHESKKRRKEGRSDHEQKIVMNSEVPWSNDEQEPKPFDETEAATNFLSQIINDDPPDKQKDPIGLDDPLASTPVTDQEKEVEMVLRSLQQLQEEMKNSPAHSPVGGSGSKSIKNDLQFTSFGGLYGKNDDKIRISKEDGPW